MKFKFDNRLERDDVGSRVVIRRWVEDAERGLAPSDVLGKLESWDEGDVLTVRTRDDDLVEVDARDILAAKTIPPPPTSRLPGEDVGSGEHPEGRAGGPE